jgi:hypothetical protein
MFIKGHTEQVEGCRLWWAGLWPSVPCTAKTLPHRSGKDPSQLPTRGYNIA